MGFLATTILLSSIHTQFPGGIFGLFMEVTDSPVFCELVEFKAVAVVTTFVAPAVTYRESLK